MVSDKILLRFMKKIQFGGDHDCWEWMASKTRQGYGNFTLTALEPSDRRQIAILAHRFMWCLNNGPIPDGLGVLHTCDNPSCVNLKHLFLGTNFDNQRDASIKGRNIQQKKTHCPSGHAYSESNTKIYNGRRVCHQCRIERDRERYRTQTSSYHKRRALSRSTN